MIKGSEFVVITTFKEGDSTKNRLDYYNKKEDAFKAKKCFETSDDFKDRIASIGVYQTAFIPIEEDE